MSIVEEAMRRVQAAQQSAPTWVAENPARPQPAEPHIWHKMVAVGGVCFLLGAATVKALPNSAEDVSLPVQQAQEMAEPASPAVPANAKSSALVAPNPGKEGDNQREVLAAVDAWVKAWSGKDVDNYLSAYAPTFQLPAGVATRSEWEKQRRKRISRYGNIDIKLSGLTVISHGDPAIVEFIQSFKTDVFSETGVRKRLELRRHDSRWMIEKEVSYKG